MHAEETRERTSEETTFLYNIRGALLTIPSLLIIKEQAH